MRIAKGCRTVFLGWERPLLHSVVDFLDQQCGRVGSAERTAARQRLLIVLPTRRAGRRLRELIARDEGGVSDKSTGPRIITVGELPEYLYHNPSGSPPLADELERTLAWTAALQQVDNDSLLPLFAAPPSRDVLAPWIELARTLLRLQEDLASAELTFADVAAALADDSAAGNDRQRWLLLQALHGEYLNQLAAAGRSDPLEARRVAIAAGDCRSDDQVWLVGTSDLSDSLTTMLRQVADRVNADGTPPVTALIAADEQLRDHFDPFGSVIASRWCQWKLSLEDNQLSAADDASDQAVAAAEWLQQPAIDRSGRITIGVTDESFVPPLEFELRQLGLSSYRELGWSFSQTPIGRLVELLVTHLSQATWQSLAALVRHADVYAWIERTVDPEIADGRWLEALDRLLAEHYPTRLDQPLTAAMLSARRGTIGADAAVAVADQVAHSLAGLEAPQKRLSDWAEELKRYFESVYPEELRLAGTLSRRGVAAIESALKMLGRMRRLGEPLDRPIAATAAIDLLAGRLMDQRIGDVDDEKSIQIAGWLDLALDDSESMAVIGFNHPYVPDSVTADPFLPGGLRTRLKMSDNERRMGRDVYATQLLLATRPETRLIVGRRGVDGSPTPPSRLLAAADPEAVARRLVALLGDDAGNRRRAAAPSLIHRWDATVDKTCLPIPRLDPDVVVPAMSVTSFAAYLACPYRFYLRYVLRLTPVDDASRELAANQFGDLIHNSLEAFGESSGKDETDPERIEEALLAALDGFAADYLGSAPAPAVRLQIEQARARLRHVAQAQSAWRKQGWQIWKVEASVGEKQNAGIDVDGERMIIRGRFDRIDRHDDGRWAILDYKTHGHPPRKKHLQRVNRDHYRWVELQLPIYRLMIPYLVGDQVDPQDVALGYFNISEKQVETKINEADFTPAEFAEAEEVIRRCVRDIRAGRFEPAEEPVPYDDYAMILQSEIAEQLFETDEAEA